MTEPTPVVRRDAAVSRIRATRAELQEALERMSAEDAFKGSEWSVADAMRHIGGRSGYITWAERLVKEGNLDFPSFPSWDEAWKRMINQTLEAFEDAAKFVESLSADDLLKAGKRRGEAVTVADLVEGIAAHYEEHVKQIRGEIKPRLGFS
ncbi:MAG: DinB family protein [Chloroflexi bacterium]|nr:DinB family protein [Chloroflexota bacterium]